MNILIYGAGAIGSIFAGRLAVSGHNITVLARGKRFDQIRNNGIILVNPRTKKKEYVEAEVIDKLQPDDIYDYILAVMQRTQVNEILPVMSQNKSENIVFIVNTASGYDEWVRAVGSERLMLGFPSAGGERAGGEVNYFIGKGILRAFQTTTFSEYSGKKTRRVQELIKAFNKAGIPSVFCPNMDAWQKTHVAMVTSIGNALYMHNSNNYELAKHYKDIKLMVKGIKEGFMILKQLGIRITPAKLNYFMLPTFLVACILKLIMGTKLAEITMAKHTSVAKSEMIYLQKEFNELIKKSKLKTPNIDKLKSSLE